MKIDLTTRDWNLAGWRPYSWKFGEPAETGLRTGAHIPAMPATVPGSVQAALLKSGWIKDWHIGLNSVECEWVEHRHWEFSSLIQDGEIPGGSPVILCADGLDYSGWILVDGKEAAEFSGALIRHRFDLTAQLGDGKSHVLHILFDEPPPEQGQVGFTSRSRYFKPRFNYSWDWCPRLVPIGIWDRLWLEVDRPAVQVKKILTELEDDFSTAVVTVWLDDIALGRPVHVELSFKGEVVASHSERFSTNSTTVRLDAKCVRPWWPNGHGEQHLYQLTVLSDLGNGELTTIESMDVGFKHVRWHPCEGAPTNAIPWICQINGKSIFLQGVNWTPPKLDYHSIKPDDYNQLIDLYREMGCNLLRVWGGSYLERREFYELCDRAGLLVWQEFPLSSSGPENWAPEDPTVIANLRVIALDYIRRRGHHACKLLWCGGNELQSSAQGSKTGIGRPLDLNHPCLAMLAEVVRTEDPQTRFLPCSSSGPTFIAARENFGKGLHHDVHGPWRVEGSIEDWRSYWERDDSLFRSETGAPAASSLGLIEKYRDKFDPWPPKLGNRYWMHTGAWWIQWDDFGKALDSLPADERLARYVLQSRDQQAVALAIAAAACKARFPRCGGILIWMGHDCFPCAANTSIIQFDLKPKPAYFAIAEVFSR